MVLSPPINQKMARAYLELDEECPRHYEVTLELQTSRFQIEAALISINRPKNTLLRALVPSIRQQIRVIPTLPAMNPDPDLVWE